jgi:hypothetical protein
MVMMGAGVLSLRIAITYRWTAWTAFKTCNHDTPQKVPDTFQNCFKGLEDGCAETTHKDGLEAVVCVIWMAIEVLLEKLTFEI